MILRQEKETKDHISFLHDKVGTLNQLINISLHTE